MSVQLKGARRLLLEAAESQECRWCRSHVLKVAEGVETLIYLNSLSEELKSHPGTLRAMRKIGETVEELRMVKLLSKLSNTRTVRFLLNVR